MKMSMPFGKCTITTTVSGSGVSPVPLLLGPAAIVLLVTLVVLLGDQIALVLGITAGTALALMVAYIVREVVADKLADRVERRWRTQVALNAITPAARLALPPSAPTTPYVVYPDREAVPIDLDALTGEQR